MAAKPNIRQVNERNGSVYLIDNVLAAFFLPKPLGDSAGAVLEAFNIYLEAIPPGSLKWASIGAGSEEWSEVNKKSFDKCRALLAPAAAKKRPMTSFELKEGKDADDAAEYSFTLIGAKPDKEVPDEVDLVEVCFPAEAASGSKADATVETLRRMAEKLSYVSGYGSPALTASESGGRGMHEAQGFAARYPGFDVQMNKLGCMDQGDRVRGARWLTFLGPDLVKKLEGADAIRKTLPKEVDVHSVGHGVMIRAGKVPEIGDVNKKVKTPLLRAVAALLEPVTQFKEDVLLKSHFANNDEALLLKWERRFLD